MELDDRELKRLKELVPYKVLAPTPDEICDEMERLNNIINKAIDKIQLIIDLGFDYDGFNQVDSLKGLIDELVSLARESRNILKGEDK